MKSPHAVILASAGTGKTFRLSNHYIRTLARGEDAGKVLATTFTRKAAGEILDRILERLAEAARDDEKRVELCGHIGVELTREACERLTVRLAESLHRVNVGTIDSFFARVLKSFGLEVGLPPTWTVVSEEADEDLRSEAIRAALEEQEGAQGAVALVRMLNRGGYVRGVHAAVMSAVKQAYSVFRQSEPGAWRQIGRGETAPTSDEVATAIAEVSAVPCPQTKAGTDNQTWFKALGKLQELAAAGEWLALLKVGLVERVMEGGTEFGRADISDAARAAIDVMVALARRALLVEVYRTNEAARELMSGFDRAYTRMKRERGWMTFDDVPRLLAQSDAVQDRQELYYRLDAQVHHLLLDEFQDTSLEQFGVLRPIMEELLSQGDGETPRSVLCVGDVKQSLYSWRGAEPELLPRLREWWPQLELEVLSANRRSSAMVLNAVNRVFTSVGGCAELSGFASARKWQEEFPAHVAAKSLAGEVRLIVADEAPEEFDAEEGGEEESAEAPDVGMARFAALRVKMLRERAPRASIAVLTRTNRPTSRLIFEMQNLGIPAIGERGNPLTDSPAASAAISALHLADHPSDTAAQFHVATSPLGPLLGATMEKADGWRLSAKLRARVARSGIAGVLAWFQRRAAGSMDAAGFARFDQLIALAKEFENEHPLDRGTAGTMGPGAFADLARRRGIDPPVIAGAGPVRVMTIHQAKGLEFDAVVLPELDREWRVKPGTVYVDRRDAEGKPDALGLVAAVSMYASAQVRGVCAELEEMHERTHDRLVSEELSGLYVAMTRARHCLEMIVKPLKKNSSAPKASAALVHALAPGAARDAGMELFSASTEARWEEGFEGAAPGGAGPARSVKFASGRKVPAGRLPRRSPSSLEGQTRVELGDMWRLAAFDSTRGAAARDRGTAFHAMFEAIEWMDEGAPSEDALRGAIERLRVADTAGLVREFDEKLTGEVAAALSRARYAGRPGDLEVKREWPFALREDGDAARVLVGRLDRVVVGMEEGRALWAEVVDFKTDELGEEGIERAAEHYRPQIEAYRRSVARLLGISVDAVSSCLVFVAVGRVVGSGQ